MKRLLREEPPICEVADLLGTGIEAEFSVPAATYAFLAHPDSFAQSLLFAVKMGGDTDTIGAMCGAISGAFHGHDAIPPKWLDALENKYMGREYAIQLAISLFEKASPLIP